jgi:hypothetical protein
MFKTGRRNRRRSYDNDIEDKACGAWSPYERPCMCHSFGGRYAGDCCVVGALGGAAVNYAFIEHFQEVARGHFTIRRLERVYGKNVGRTEYERLASGISPNLPPPRDASLARQDS